MFDTVLLRTFVTVAQENGFTRAAEKLSLTQSAISTHLRRLEEQVGKPLLTRTTRSVALTPDGEILMTYARAILSLNRDAQARLSGLAKPLTLRIGLPEDFANAILMAALQQFAERHAGLTLEMEVGLQADLLQALDDGGLDLAIGGHCHSKRRGKLLWKEPLAWVFAEQAALVLPAPLPLAFFPEPCPYREVAVAALARSGTPYRIALRCSSVAGMIAAARAGFAIAAIPASQIRSGLRRIGVGQGLPALPDVEFMLFARSNSGGPADGLLGELAEALLAALGTAQG
ncbi:MAG: LysR substrate-binding domain-containing protein [Pseudomonadota bacterium]